MLKPAIRYHPATNITSNAATRHRNIGLGSIQLLITLLSKGGRKVTRAGRSGIHLVVIVIPEHKSGTFSVTDLMEIMTYLITGVMDIYITPPDQTDCVPAGTQSAD